MKDFNTLLKFFIVSLILCLSFYALPHYSFGQVTQEWSARYNSGGNRLEMPWAMVVDGSGNVFVTGSTRSDAYTNDHDYVTVKYNSSGVQQWANTYNGTSNGKDVAYAIVTDNSGNVYVTGESYDTNNDYDAVTIKYNSAGTVQWIQKFITIFENRARAMTIDASGNIYVYSEQWPNLLILKYSSSGALLWTAPGTGSEGIPSGIYGISYDFMKVDANGNVYVIAEDRNGGNGPDFATLKYNTSGTLLWKVKYSGPQTFSDDVPCSLDIDGYGNVYVTGISEGVSNDDFATVKYNSTGVQQWVARYNTGVNDWPTAVKVDANANVFVTGTTLGGITTIKYNSSGVQQWVAVCDSAKYVFSMDLDALGNIYVAGESLWNDYLTVKYNTSGVQKWVKAYDGPDHLSDRAQIVKVGPSNNVFLTGYSHGNSTITDFVTIKYSQQVGIQNISTEIPSSYSLGQNYPNPFNPITKIRFAIPNDKLITNNVQLIVYDVTGREVETLVNESLKPGTYEAAFDGSMLNSGVYFYKLVTDGFTETKKMILLK